MNHAMSSSPEALPSAATHHVQEVVSPGGLRAYLIQEPALPIIAMTAYFRGGASLDPEGRAGLANMASSLVDEGAGDLDSQAFRAALDDDAIRLHVDASRDAITVELKTLSANRARAFELTRLAVTAPRFDEEPVERVRSQIQADLRRRAIDPEHVAARAWREQAFDGHPYGRPVRGTAESVAAITVEDMREHVVSRLSRDRLCIGVSGDISAEELAGRLDEVFAALPASAELPAVPPVSPRTGAVHIAPMPIPQSVVQFGHAGIPRTHPDHYPAYIVNYILGGGGFSSRLLEEIREKRGLAYSVYSYLDDGVHSPLWLGSLATRNEQVALSIDLLREQLGRMAEGDIDASELQDAKTYLTGSFPLRLTSNDQVARALAGMQVWNLGLDFLERRNSLVYAVTLEDARRVARQLFAQPLLLVIAGDPKGIDPSA
jgi:zinc protease